MKKNLTVVGTKQEFESREIDCLNFYGMVKDNNGVDVGDAIVLVLAYFLGGIEEPLAYTFTDQEGRYFISIPKLPDNHDLLGYKVRAGKPHIPSKAFVRSPCCCQKELCNEPVLDTVQGPVKECVAEQESISAVEDNFTDSTVLEKDKITSEINLSLPADNHVFELIDLSKVGESIYSRQPWDGVIFVELNQSESFNVMPIEVNKKPIKKNQNVYKRYAFNSAKIFLLLLSLFGIFVADAKGNYSMINK